MHTQMSIVSIKTKATIYLRYPIDYVSDKTKNWPENVKLLLIGFLFGLILVFITNRLFEVFHTPDPEYTINDTPLADRVKILCLVLTSEENHVTRAIHVKQTWAKRCNRLIFASSIDDDNLGAKRFDIYDTSEKPWRRVKKMFEYAYVEYLEDYDWFFKADDDTYAFIDNMRYMLAAYSPNDPIYFGRKLRSDVHRQGYLFGGSGYVMSRRALQRFIEDAIPNEELCRLDWGGREDYEMGNCMNNIGIYTGDSRDDQRRETFFPADPKSHLFPTFGRNYYERMFYRSEEGFLSNYTISFHSVEPWMMYLIEYLVFDLQKHGIEYIHPKFDREMDFTWLAGVLDNQTAEKP